ncbi:hypothetical protein [Roseibium sp.]|uniref:hypothetical protein n=1 Tax=Roseibium sp. TaxID=1936156 RepID=UPI003A9774E6
MSKRSSSWNSVCGDIPLNAVDRARYKANAWLERVRQRFQSFPAPVEAYEPHLDADRLIADFGDPIRVASPTRALCYDFVANKMPEIVGERPSVLDLGCGNGNYAQHLKIALNFRHYQGYDIKESPEWPKYRSDEIEFGTATLGVDEIDVGDATCVFSQSVLEHVRYDAEVFGLLRSKSPKTIRHVHCVPTPESHVEHRYHGYRRYGPGELTRLLDHPGLSNIRIYALGNSATREMYWHQRHKPKRFASRSERKRYPYLYDQNLTCVENLQRNRQSIKPLHPIEASFYILTFDQQL